MTALVPTAQQISSWAVFGALIAGTFFVLVLAWRLVNHYLGQLQDRIEQRDTAAAEAYHRASLEVASRTQHLRRPPLDFYVGYQGPATTNVPQCQFCDCYDIPGHREAAHPRRVS